MEIAFLIIVWLILGVVVAQWGRIWWYGRISNRLIDKADALSSAPADPDRTILIIGDSLWAGVGAKDPENSMAGRLIADLPNARVLNQAESGARIADGMLQLTEAVAAHGAFDQVVIQLGANDILNFTNLSDAKDDLTELLQTADRYSADVAYMVSGSLGSAPVFFPPLNWIYNSRSRHFLKALGRVARDAGVTYVDLYRTKERDPFYKDPDTYYAPDKFHPSGSGYGLWYEKCRQELACFRYGDQPSVKDKVADEPQSQAAQEAREKLNELEAEGEEPKEKPEKPRGPVDPEQDDLDKAEAEMEEEKTEGSEDQHSESADGSEADEQ